MRHRECRRGGPTPDALADTLFNRYKIWTVAIDGAGVHGVRVTPHLFTSTGELDALVKALRELAGELPGSACPERLEGDRVQAFVKGDDLGATGGSPGQRP